jgi:DNA-binding XRE family transcriptional regulator
MTSSRSDDEKISIDRRPPCAGRALPYIRAMDSGRRNVPPGLLAKGQDLVRMAGADGLMPLRALARIIHVHPRTLWSAARDGRFKANYDGRTMYRQLIGRASIAEALRFKRECYRKRGARRTLTRTRKWTDIPHDFHLRIRETRLRLGLSQAGLAALVGAANKAVVYQWETRRRCPSPVFWTRVEELTRPRRRSAS